MGSVHSQDNRSLRWNRYDVTINNFDTSTNRFDVTESYVLAIETGPFSFGFAEIPMDRLERITNVIVYQDGTPLNATCSGARGTFCATGIEDYSIRYYFRRRRNGDRVNMTSGTPSWARCARMKTAPVVLGSRARRPRLPDHGVDC